MKCLLVGVEKNCYTDKNSGELKVSNTLHVVYDKPSRTSPDFRGQKVDAVKTRLNVDDLQLGHRYDLIFEQVRYGQKAFLDLVDVLAVD